MKDDLTDITLVLDRSGSMHTILADTIGGFNAFVADQRAAHGDAALTLVQFDDTHETMYTAKPLKDVPELTTATFVPRGMTALLDALGATIAATGERLAAMPEAERPGKVLFVILTDGQENRSKEYRKPAILKMVKTQTDQFNWQFIYIGANQDAIGEAGSIGIRSAVDFRADSKGTQDAYASLSTATRSYREGKGWGISPPSGKM